MATRMYPQILRSYPTGAEVAVGFIDYYDMLTVRGAAVTGIGVDTDLNAAGEYPIAAVDTPQLKLFSERVSAEVTVSGTVTFNLWAIRNVTDFTGKLRARLYKVTAGGSNIETLIATGDSANLSGSVGVSTLYNFTATPGTAVTLGPNERFVMRVSVVVSSGTLSSTIAVQVRIGSASASVDGDTWVELTETITMLPNGTTLYLRRTTTAGISTHFDMLETRGGSAATTGVVNTVAGPTAQIQWTRTAGGTLLSWVSPRFSRNWNPTRSDYFGILQYWAHESAAAANCMTKASAYRLRSGVETLTISWTQGSPSVELPTTATKITVIASTHDTTVTFVEDDRLVLKAFIDDGGSSNMGSGRTCTLTYDHNVAGGTGDCSLTLNDAPTFKGEADGPSSQVVPNAGMLGGVSNGT